MDILNYLHSKSISITIDNLLIGAILIFCVLAILRLLFYFFRKKVKIVNLNIEIGNIGNITLELNKEVSKIAHKTWVEIMTRKVGLTFEEDKDVIVEVYNSWYKLFEIIRELLKNVDTKYGKNVIKDYSKRLTNKFGKKYTSSLLYKIIGSLTIKPSLPFFIPCIKKSFAELF